MGFLIFLTAQALFVVGFSLLLPSGYTFVKAENDLKEKFTIGEYLELGVSPQRARALLIEEADRMVNRACQIGKAWIIRCQECFLEGRSFCPYPTQSFCVSAVSASVNDFDLLYGFLPNNAGLLSEIWDSPSMNPNNMTDISQIPLGIRWIIQNQYPRAVFGVFGYEKPSSSIGVDPCAVTEIVVNG